LNKLDIVKLGRVRFKIRDFKTESIPANTDNEVRSIFNPQLNQSSDAMELDKNQIMFVPQSNL
jgi:hypothetical protein